MIHVQKMQPFYTKVTGSKLRIVFAYQYFSIRKEDETYYFIPIEGKEIVVNLNTMQVENMSDVFVFQKANKFIRLPLYQLLLVSNLHDHLIPLIERFAGRQPEEASSESETQTDAEALKLIHFLEQGNWGRLIDQALADRNEAAFYDLLTKQAAAIAKESSLLEGGMQ